MGNQSYFKSSPQHHYTLLCFKLLMLTPHDDRISPFPCLPACPRVPACLCIKSSANKWILSSGLGQGRTKAFLSCHLAWVCRHIVFACSSADQQQLCRMKQSCWRNVYDGDFVKLINSIEYYKKSFLKVDPEATYKNCNRYICNLTEAVDQRIKAS